MFQFKKKVFKSSENVSVQDTPSPTDVEITCSYFKLPSTSCLRQQHWDKMKHWPVRRQALRLRHQEPCPQWPASCSAQYSAACWSVTGNQSHPVSQQQATNHIQCHNNRLPITSSVTTAGNQSHPVSQQSHPVSQHCRQPIPYSVTTGNQSHPVSQQQATNHSQCHKVCALFPHNQEQQLPSLHPLIHSFWNHTGKWVCVLGRVGVVCGCQLFWSDSVPSKSGTKCTAACILMSSHINVVSSDPFWVFALVCAFRRQAYVYMCACACTYACACVCMHPCIHACVHAHVSMCMCVSVWRREGRGDVTSLTS